MFALKDTWTMTKRSLKHIARSPDTIITVVISPIALLLMFVYVLGGALKQQAGGANYVDFITPGIIIFSVVSGLAYAAFRLNNDIQYNGTFGPITARCAIFNSERSSGVFDTFKLVLIGIGSWRGLCGGFPHERWLKRVVALCGFACAVYACYYLDGDVLRSNG